MSKSAFLGAPFADYLDSRTGVLKEEKRAFITQIMAVLEKNGYQIENAHAREGWGKDWMPPETCTPIDYLAIKSSDLFIAIPGNPPSGGVHIELGWASALETNIVLLLEEGKNYSNLVLGLGTVGKVAYVQYRTQDDCLQKLDDLLGRE